MLLPRPEIRIATRFGSRIVRCGPILGRVPGAGPACHGAAATSFFDPADPEGSFAGTLDGAHNVVRSVRSDDHDHADAAVESARHFLGCDVSTFLKKCKNRWEFPAIDV